MRTAVEIPIVSLIYNRYGQASATQDAVIEIRVYYNRKAKYMSTRIRVFPKEWQRGRVVNRVDAVIINKQLDRLLIDVRQTIYDMYDAGQIDIDAIPSRLKAKRKPSISLLDFCEERAKIRKYGKAVDTQKRYDRFLRFLKEYAKIRTFYDLTEAKVLELDRYLQKQNNMKAKSRWNNYHRFLDAFINDAKKKALVTVNPYDNVNLEKGDDTDAINKCLFPEELEALSEVQMPSERLERVRDLFVFQSYTGFAFKDFKNFDPMRLREKNGKIVYVEDRKKSKKQFTIPFLPPAKKILDKYERKLPLISNVKYNKYLKEVAAAAGIDKPLTTHWARHTAGTFLLNAGVSIEIVSKVLGHASIRMTERIYAKMLTDTVVKNVNEKYEEWQQKQK